MRMYDLIAKKRDKKDLSTNEINWIIENYVSHKIPDYQMSAFLMAVYLNSMTDKELLDLTLAMAKSGNVMDLSDITGIKVDKHSTGGVGDKTTLIVAPIVAACGVKVAKMSGRSLGHTGGTIDKLEAIPNFKTSLLKSEFVEIINNIGLSVMGQSENIAPADKLMYALRDATATVESIPLIAASIMSKKLAAGSDCILLDVKTGSGAFMKTFDESIKLARKMVSIGENAGKKTMALITDMSVPLGKNIGNSLEVIEAVDVLNSNGASDLTSVCISLAENMLFLAEKGSTKKCHKLAKNALSSGAALHKLADMVKAQSGESEVIFDTSKLKSAEYTENIIADKCGYITSMNTEDCGISALLLGAGRETKESQLDYSAGIVLKKKTGDYVKKGEVIAVMHASEKARFNIANAKFSSAIIISESAPELKSHILAKITKDEIIKYI